MAVSPINPGDKGVSIEVMKYVLDCDPKTISLYAASGLVVKLGRGRYAMAQSVRNVIRRLREQAAGRMGRTDNVDAVRSGAALKDAQRELTELRSARLKGELISFPEIEAAWSEIATATKQLFLSLPGRARFDIPHLTAADQKVLDKLVREMLTEVAFSGPVQVPEKVKGDAGASEED